VNNKKKKVPLIIIGANIKGHAAEVLETASEIGQFQVLGFIDNSPHLQGTNVDGIPILGTTDDLELLDLPCSNFHIAIGDNIARQTVYQRLKACNSQLISLVHPTAIVNPGATVDEGNYIGPMAIITRGVRVGAVSIIDSGSIVQPDTRIGVSVFLSAGVTVANRVRIDNTSFIGLGVTILPDIQIGSGVMVGAGATVVKNVPSGTTMRGFSQKEYPKDIFLDARPDVAPAHPVYVAQPTLPEYSLLNEKFTKILESRMLSNFSQYSSQLELNLQQLLSVRRALTFPNGTSALMLALKMLDLTGEVILPSFTFSATGHAVMWNGLTPVFADIDPDTFNIDPEDIERKITERTSAILAVHIFGNPCDIHRLEAIAERHNLKLIFDSAHALGSKYKGTELGGFGDVECFSLSGTKVVTSAEGGVATSNDNALMNKMDMGRNYGAGSDYNCHYLGLNGKMSEFHAAIAIETLTMLPEFVHIRNERAALYRKRLSEIPGIRFQKIDKMNVSTFKDFAIVIHPEIFGMSRKVLIKKLNEEGIFPKQYFYPPLHAMAIYKRFNHTRANLNNTLDVANNIICLPIYSHMKTDTLEKICYAIFRTWRDGNRG